MVRQAHYAGFAVADGEGGKQRLGRNARLVGEAIEWSRILRLFL